MNSTGLNSFFKYSSVECEHMRVKGKRDNHLENHPYHIKAEDLCRYIDENECGGEDLLEVYRMHREGFGDTVGHYSACRYHLSEQSAWYYDLKGEIRLWAQNMLYYLTDKKKKTREEAINILYRSRI